MIKVVKSVITATALLTAKSHILIDIIVYLTKNTVDNYKRHD